MIKLLVELKRKLNGEVSLKKLIKKGLVVGNNFSKQSGCFIDPTFPFLIEIGNDVTFSKNVCILSHDASTRRKLGYSKIGIVKIGNNCFIGANVTILPNVRIGNDCIVGAGTVINRDIPENSVVFGNPATVLCKTDKYYEKNKKNMRKDNCFNANYYKNNNKKMKQELKEKCKNEICYIE